MLTLTSSKDQSKYGITELLAYVWSFLIFLHSEAQI